VSKILLLAPVNNLPLWWNFNTHPAFSGLHCASFFRIVEVVSGLIEMGCYNINGEDFPGGGGGPLAWAARNGHEEVVKILLGREEVNPHKPDNDGRTLIEFAAWYRHGGVVKMLLGRKMPSRASQTMTAEHRSRFPLGKAMREWWKCYLSEKRSTRTSEVMMAEYRSRLPPGMDMEEW